MRLVVSLLVAFAIAEIAILIWATLSYHALARLDIVPTEKFNTVHTNLFNIDSELIKNEIGDLDGDDFSKALTLCAWVTNQANPDGEGNLPSDSRTPYRVLEAMHKGTGASCGYRSLLYTSTLQNTDIEARMVTLLNEDTTFVHTTTEVLINDRWVVIDPTYNVYFTINGQYASASDLHWWVVNGGTTPIVVNGNDSATPVKYDSTLPSAFRHVSVYERRYYSPWQMLPVIQFIYGGSVVVLENSHIVNMAEVVFRNIMVALCNFILPLGIYYLAFIIVAEKMHC